MIGNLAKRRKRSKPQFIRPPNMLKAKVGSGGLADDILEKAQALLENSATDFTPMADEYLSILREAINDSLKPPGRRVNDEPIIPRMILASMSLKANGGMFNFPLVSRIAARLITFLEVVAETDRDVAEIALACHATMRAVVNGRVTGDGGAYGDELLGALDQACERYLKRNPDNRAFTLN